MEVQDLLANEPVDPQILFSYEQEKDGNTMQRFKNILAVYGDNLGTEDVLDRAEALALSNGASLTLIETHSSRDMTDAKKSEQHKRLSRIASSLRTNNVKVEIVCGIPHEEIIRAVLRNKHDIVIAGADSGTTLQGLYFGSVAKHLTRKCPCPVWVLHPGRKRKAAKILACVDPQFDSAIENGMDRKILELASSLARSKHAELHVIHAWDVTGKDLTTIRSEVRDVDAQAILKRHKEDRRNRIRNLIDTVDLSGLHREIHLPRASPQSAIVACVKERKIELVVMGTACRVGLSGFFVGNSAETVLNAVRCGVLTVKPSGFVSPVRPEFEHAYT